MSKHILPRTGKLDNYTGKKLIGPGDYIHYIDGTPCSLKEYLDYVTKLDNTDTSESTGYEIEGIFVTEKEFHDYINQCDNTDTEQVDHPSHYNKGNIEVIEVIEDWDLNFARGSVIKYVGRAGHKSDELEDLKKALWYIEREISRLSE